MEFSITYRGAPAGGGRFRLVRGGLEITAHCTLYTADVLRLFGIGPEGRAVRIGVLEPDARGALRLTRFLSAETLRQAGFSASTPPAAYVLSDTAAPPVMEAPADTGADTETAVSADAVSCDEADAMPSQQPTEDADTTGTLPAAADPLPDHLTSAQAAPAPPVRTGDRLVDAAVAAGLAVAVPAPNGWTVSCPFTPGTACALHFALPACTVGAGRAVLQLTPGTQADSTHSHGPHAVQS